MAEKTFVAKNQNKVLKPRLWRAGSIVIKEIHMKIRAFQSVVFNRPMPSADSCFQKSSLVSRDLCFYFKKRPLYCLWAFFLMKWTEVAPSSQDSAKKISFKPTAEGISLFKSDVPFICKICTSGVLCIKDLTTNRRATVFVSYLFLCQIRKYRYVVVKAEMFLTTAAVSLSSSCALAVAIPSRNSNSDPLNFTQQNILHTVALYHFLGTSVFPDHQTIKWTILKR